MEIPSAVIAFTIIMGIAYWINSSREEKERVAANEKAAGVAKAHSDDIDRAKSKVRKTIHARASEFGVDYTIDELDWICNNAVSHSGKKGLEDIGRMFATAPKDKLEALMMKIEVEHFKYLTEQQATQRTNEAERKWQTILEDFKRLNPAQQKSHLTYIKKHHAGELTNEQLHILELVSLGEANTPKSKDIEVGGVKLFTMKEK